MVKKGSHMVDVKDDELPVKISKHKNKSHTKAKSEVQKKYVKEQKPRRYRSKLSTSQPSKKRLKGSHMDDLTIKSPSLQKQKAAKDCDMNSFRNKTAGKYSPTLR